MARIVVVDDEVRMATLIQRELVDRGHDAVTATEGEAALELLDSAPFDLVLTDLRMPGMDGLVLLEEVKRRHPRTEVILMTAFATAQTAVRAMKEGAFDYLIKPFEMDELGIMVERIAERTRLQIENAALRLEIAGGSPEIVAASPQMKEALQLVDRVAPQETTVLIQGESGTGKELVARAIHARSGRADAPMVTVNCAAIPETLIESELFGHERGAFTGAEQQRLGRFELAARGTLFLDEITEMSASAQAKLLRALQERTIERVGGEKSISVDVRVVAASNRDLRTAVEEGVLREDLYYRLKVFPIDLAPLRDRPEDVVPLAEHFTTALGRGNRLSAPALDLLCRYAWPGNVRELANVIERAVILAGPGEDLTEEHLADLEGPTVQELIAAEEDTERPARPRSAGSARVHIPDEGVDLEVLEREHIEEALRKTGGNKSEAARLLHMTRRRLYSRMKHHEIGY